MLFQALAVAAEEPAQSETLALAEFRGNRAAAKSGRALSNRSRCGRHSAKRGWRGTTHGHEYGYQSGATAGRRSKGGRSPITRRVGTRENRGVVGAAAGNGRGGMGQPTSVCASR
jgi:hypothetical protein